MDQGNYMCDEKTFIVTTEYEFLVMDNKTDTVVIGHADLFPSITSYLVDLYRAQQTTDSNQLILNQEDQLICVQLCLAEMNKQETGDFDVEMSTVIDMNERLCCDKLNIPGNKPHSDDDKFTALSQSYSNFIKRCNLVDLMDVLFAVMRTECSEKCIVLHRPPSSKVEELFLNHLCGNRMLLYVNEAGERARCSTLEDCLAHLSTVAPTSPVSVTEDYVRGIFLSYLQLLVNSRCELALARVFNVPERELDQRSFTDLRRLAVEKRLSMCQTVISHVMRIRLGGKSYRPDPDCPLGQHIKGLSELVDLLNKLQTVMEEEGNAKLAIEKVMRIIRTALLRCKSNAIKWGTIEKVSNRLEEAALRVLTRIQDIRQPTPNKKASEGGSARGRYTVYVLLNLLDQDATRPCTLRVANVLGDTFSTQRTPIRFPSIMSKFRSPELEEINGEECNTSVCRVGQIQNNNKVGVNVPRFGACLDWADQSVMTRSRDDHIFSEEEITLLNKASALHVSNRTLTSPLPKPVSKLIPVPDESSADQENLNHESVVATSKHGGKRRTKADVGSSPGRKRAKKVAPKKSARIAQPAKGQKRLTDFFRI